MLHNLVDSGLFIKMCIYKTRSNSFTAHARPPDSDDVMFLALL